MAGEPGYYLVGLPGNAGNGIVKVPAGRYPVSVGSHPVSTIAYLGTTIGDVKKNWVEALHKTQLDRSLLTEVGPSDVANLAGIADKHGAGILTHVDAAQADPYPAAVFTAFFGGLGVVRALAVRSVEGAGAAAGEVGAGEVGGGAEAGTATKAVGAGGVGAAAGKGVVSTVASKGAQALTGAASALSVSALFSNIGLWKGVGMVLAGAVLVLIGILNLAGVDPGGIGHTAKRMMG